MVRFNNEPNHEARLMNHWFSYQLGQVGRQIAVKIYVVKLVIEFQIWVTLRALDMLQYIASANKWQPFSFNSANAVNQAWQGRRLQRSAIQKAY